MKFIQCCVAIILYAHIPVALGHEGHDATAIDAIAIFGTHYHISSLFGAVLLTLLALSIFVPVRRKSRSKYRR